MKLKVIATALTAAAITLAGTTAAQADDVVYRGEARATAICQAVVEDNAKELRLQLRKAAREDRMTRVSPNVAKQFQCNGESLEDFARSQGARNSIAHLTGESAVKSVAQN